MKNRNNEKREYLIAGLIGAGSTLLIVGLIFYGFVTQKKAQIFDYLLKGYQNNGSQIVSKDTSLNGLIGNNPEASSLHESMTILTVAAARPAVVSIVVSKDMPTYAPVRPNPSNPYGDPYGGLFNFRPQYQQNGTQNQKIGGGSGFLVSADGLIVTNRHVVSDTTAQYTVYTNDGKKYPATVVARDEVLDIAVLKIQGTKDVNFAYLSLGDSDALKIGQSAIAIGNALGEFTNTVSVGVVSGLARSITAGDMRGQSEELDQVIQTDAAINPGNSGGPLLDLSGRVIGVNVAVAEGSQSIGFALPISPVISIIKSIQENGKIIRPYLGVRYVSIDADIVEKNHLSVDYGALVTSGVANQPAVLQGSPAAQAGLKEGDIILEFDGVKLDQGKSLSILIRQKQPEQKVSLKVLSGKTERNINVVLGTAKDTQ